jgi:hypothetical protein
MTLRCKAAWIAILLAGLVLPADAAPPKKSAIGLPESAVPRRRVAILPGRDFRIDPGALFIEGEPVSSPDAGAILADAVARTLAREPEVATVRPADLRQSAESTESPELVVRGLLHLGQERYRDIRIPEAISALEQGIASARKVYLDILSPDLMSDLYLYQGLCHVEQGQTAQAHVAFKNLLLVTPGRKFRKGWFPQATEAAMRTAAEDFIRTNPKESLMGGLERVEAFLKFARATAAVATYLTGAPGEAGAVEVRVAEVSRQSGGHLVLVARGESPWSGPEAAADTASRTVSGWLACAVLPSREVVEKPLARFYLDTTAAYSVFLRVPTRRLFSNAGFGIGLAWQVKEGLDVFGRVNVLNAFEDKFGDLVKQFWTIRVTAGVGYSLRGNWGRVFLHTGLAFDYLRDFESTTDPNCKFWPNDPARCPASNVRRPTYLLGGAVALGINATIYGPIYFAFQVGVAAYFVSNESDTPVNFPISLEAGLGYAFF